MSFCPEDENALALAASDSCVYVYDIRNISEPLQVSADPDFLHCGLFADTLMSFVPPDE